MKVLDIVEHLPVLDQFGNLEKAKELDELEETEGRGWREKGVGKRSEGSGAGAGDDACVCERGGGEGLYEGADDLI